MSIPVKGMCPHLISAILKYCVGDDELLELGLESTASGNSYARRSSTLNFLGNLCQEREGPSNFLGDLLDMRFLNTVLAVRELDMGGVQMMVAAWEGDPCGAALPGLIWALCTDPRPCVQKTGFYLSMEADWIGRSRLIFGNEERTTN
jgi:hypothetical protein